jgi:tol-pal system protein YbgF
LDMEIQRLRDMVERSQAAGGDQQQIRKLQERLAFVEKQLGIEAAERPAPSPTPPVTQDVRPPAPPALGIPEGPRDERQAPAPNIGAAAGGGMMPANAPVEIRDAPLPDEERAYRDAHAAFRTGDNDRALQLFDEFVKKYPKNRFAASAIYWIGEARFAQGNYEEAVLQFDRVIKEYAGSNKHVSALLKQGQAFEKMGDVRSARIIFQKIVKEHPHTAQARIAGGRLKALPPDVSWNYSTPY